MEGVSRTTFICFFANYSQEGKAYGVHFPRLEKWILKVNH